MSFMNDAAVNHQVAYARISDFLGREAMLLDENRLQEWVDTLDPAIVYEIPVRQSEDRDGKNEFPQNAYRLRDDLPMIKKRLERIATGEAWAETPPTRTVRVVGSITIERADQ